MYKRAILLAFFASLAAGCTTVGPDYAGPPHVTVPTAFKAPTTSGGYPAVSPWWSQLDDPVLNSLLDRALGTSPGLAVAQARVRQARAVFQGERANQRPKGGMTLLAAHARLPSGGDGAQASSLDLYNAGFDATWEIDLFGGRRRAAEAAEASAQAMEASLVDVHVSLAADIAQDYVNLRGCQQRIALTDAAIARQQRALELIQRRRQAGAASELDLARLQAQLEATRADAGPLVAELDAYRNALAVLLGQPPGTLDIELAQPGRVPLPPAAVAVAEPVALLRSRPDVRAAERTLAARTAQIGQAESARFPRVTFMGLIGIGGTHLSDLTRLDDFVALAAPQLSWNFLDFGRNAATIEKANALRDEAEAQYRIAVLGALRDAEDALSRFRQRRITVATRARARMAAEHTADLTRARQRAGTATLIDLLDAERTQINAEQGLALAEVALTSDFISVQKALGLGWTNSNPP
ncbi:efflux transporter outer membrane subunit [Massilia orientalis]|uniref:Efflux transporter outer membrane subunit n=1 Tax=Massilia orientalis TaxID=3050128 RepID=A0ACC7MKL8_9BURK|nr:efflux transporter outer membrane subunit [Massilia sp. YIM B02787]